MSEAEHNLHSIVSTDQVVRVVQLTDTHLFGQAGTKLLGVDTDLSLQAVIDLVCRESPNPHLLLGTGDLSDGGAQDAYRRLVDYFDGLCEENFWLCGNHDNRENMAAIIGESQRLCREIRVGSWQILLLNSQVHGAVGGQLGADELAFLEQALASAEESSLHSLVCLHHQPVKIGTAWLDQQMVSDADAFFSVLDQYPAVKAVLWGHVHQEFDCPRGDVRLLASPSTCVQFAPGHDDFQAHDAPPGYRWLDLYADGRLETGVSRVTDVTFDVDLDSGGYL